MVNGFLAENIVYHSCITYYDTELIYLPSYSKINRIKISNNFVFSLYYVKGTVGDKKYKARAALKTFTYILYCPNIRYALNNATNHFDFLKSNSIEWVGSIFSSQFHTNPPC